MLPVMARAVTDSLYEASRLTFTVEGISVAVLSTLPTQQQKSSAFQSRSVHGQSPRQEGKVQEDSSSSPGEPDACFGSERGNRDSASRRVRHLLSATIAVCSVQIPL